MVQRMAGALGFRDFPGLPVTKENRNGSHRTLHFPSLSPKSLLRSLKRAPIGMVLYRWPFYDV